METNMTHRKRSRQAALKRKRRRQRRNRRLLIAASFAAALMLVTGKVKREYDIHTEQADPDVQLTQITQDQEIPESLRELAGRNPETLSFVQGYLQKSNDAGQIDLSKEVTQGKIPLFLQWDERWGYEYYGGDFLAVTGCGPTCLSMVYCGLTGDTAFNPYEVAKKAEAMGYYEQGIGSSWSMMTGLAEVLGLHAKEVVFDERHIRSCLEQGSPIICVMGPGDFTTSGHFIVMTGVKEDGTIQVNDPNSRNRSKESWELDTLMRQIRNLWSYE